MEHLLRGEDEGNKDNVDKRAREKDDDTKKAREKETKAKDDGEGSRADTFQSKLAVAGRLA